MRNVVKLPILLPILFTSYLFKKQISSDALLA